MVSRILRIMSLPSESTHSVTPHPVRIRLLGGLSVQVEGHEYVGELQRQTVYLLALLVLRKKSDTLVIQDML
jgi:hypothetical protein